MAAAGRPRAIQRGERVLLRRPNSSDEYEFCRLRRASADFLRRWEPSGDESRRGRSEAFRAMLRQSRSPRFEKLLVCDRGEGHILGYIAINEIVRGVFLSGYLGYFIGEKHARQGYMSEALELTLAHAFGHLELHRIEANILPENTASLRLVARAGFRKEGVSRRYLKIAGRWRDHERWALLAEEFEGQAR